MNLVRVLLIVAVVCIGGFLLLANLYQVPEGPPYREVWLDPSEGKRGGSAIVPTKYYDQCPFWVRLGTEYGFPFVGLALILAALLFVKARDY